MSDASEPDGTDPRILQKEGVEVITPTTVGANAHQRYHKPGCRRLETITRGTNTVDRAVAKWKGLEPCQTCHGPRRNDNGNGTAIEGPAVDRWRKALVWSDATTREVAAAEEISQTTVRRHARGIATDRYNNPPETPPLFYSNRVKAWVWDGKADVEDST